MKKIIAFVLVLVMLLTSTTMSFAATRTREKEKYNYVSIGASQTAGYGLPGWSKNTQYLAGLSELEGFQLVEGCFSDLVQKLLQEKLPDKNVVLKQLAISCARANELMLFLEDDYKIDYFADELFIDGDYSILSDFGNATKQTTSEAFTSLKAIYRETLKEADFITYDLGCGNFSLAIDPLSGTVEDYESILSADEYKLFKQFRKTVSTQVNALLKSLDIDAAGIQSLTAWIDSMTYTLVGYCISLDRAMEWIYNNNDNQDLTVLVMQIQNFVSGMDLSIDGVCIPIGDIINILITLANSYAATCSKYSNKYIYVRTTDDNELERIIDDFMAYKTGDDLTQLKSILEDHELPHFDVRVKQVFEKVCMDPKYSAAKDSPEALDCVYDAYIRLNQRIMNDDVTSKWFDASDKSTEGSKALNGTFGAIVDEFIEQLISEYCDDPDSLDMTSAIDDAITKLETDEESHAYTKYYLEFSLGGTALLHPSKEGYKQLATAVENVLESDDNTIDRKLDGFKYAVNGIFTTTNRIVKYTVSKTQKTINTKIENIQARVQEKLHGLIGELIPRIL